MTDLRSSLSLRSSFAILLDYQAAYFFEVGIFVASLAFGDSYCFELLSQLMNASESIRMLNIGSSFIFH